MPVKPRRGEVWYVELDPTRGSEMQKTRPCVVMSSESVGVLPVRLVVPITSWSLDFAGKRWLVALAPGPGTGLVRASAADTLQTRCVALERFDTGGAVGKLPESVLQEIAAAIAVVVELDLS